MSDRLIFVAVPVPALGLLTYRVPADQPMPARGARVVVPMGPRTMTGVVIGEAAAADTAYTIKPITHIVDDHAFIPPEVVKLTEWVSEYYLAGPGATLAAALPPHGLTAKTDRFKTVRISTLTAAGLDAAERLVAHSAEPAAGPRRSRRSAEREGGRLGRRQVEGLQLLKGAPDGLTLPSLSERGITSAALTRLQSLGLVSIREERVDRDPFEHAVSAITPHADRDATPEQQQALAQLQPLAAAQKFHVALVHGVTGSGKTEVYLRLAEAVRRTGRGVLMLVPEIALTPQVAALFRARFGESVAIQHSGLSDGERHDQWHRIRRGDVDVVIGTRSAVFAPLANPGLIIVDEEHDTSYKQD
ncbi:MAG: DEAD/DEAH box helicase, partial [Vicinamibacterales bacterium]